MGKDHEPAGDGVLRMGEDRRDQDTAEVCRVIRFCAAMSTFRNGATVVVNVYWTSVLSAVAVFLVVVHIQCQVIGISVHTEIVAEIS